MQGSNSLAFLLNTVETEYKGAGSVNQPVNQPAATRRPPVACFTRLDKG
jgi:hypothetical protein